MTDERPHVILTNVGLYNDADLRALLSLTTFSPTMQSPSNSSAMPPGHHTCTKTRKYNLWVLW